MASRRIFDIIFRTKGAEKSKKESDQLGGSLDKLAGIAKTLKPIPVSEALTLESLISSLLNKKNLVMSR